MQAQGNLTAGTPGFKLGVDSSYSNGWRQLWKHFGELLLMFIIWAAITYIPSAVLGFILTPGIFKPMMGIPTGKLITYDIVTWAYAILITGPLTFGLTYAYLKAARGDKVEIKDMFASFLNYGNAVLSYLLVSIVTVIGTFLLIVPGIVVGCKLSFVPYLVVEKRMGAIQAMKTSWKMTGGGRSWKVFLIVLLAIPIFIGGFICLIVGVIIAGMWASMAMASYYHAVSMENQASAPPQQV